MTTLSIHHRTVYNYNRPVALSPHRLMLRPRESRELRLVSHTIETDPQANLSWAQDVAGNMVATASFTSEVTELVISSLAQIELNAVAWPVFPVAISAMSFPFEYGDDEWTDLGALASHSDADESPALQAWAQSFVRSNPTDTLALLKDINEGVAARISYQSREDEGTQSPEQTLSRGWGSCRDFAVLFVGAVRALGFGARIVSGYLYNPGRELVGSTDSGATHAWAEVYVPGAGWITFDPTNHAVGGLNLIPVAVGRDIRLVTPVSGSFIGATDAFIGMSVEVRVGPVE